MMPLLLSTHVAGAPHAGMPTDAMLNELSRHLAATSSRRHSRGSVGQRTGNAMRITKPSSANNSPQSALLQARRRTMMADAYLGRIPAPSIENTYMPTPDPDVYEDPMNDISKRSSRPVSWHPSTHQLSQYRHQPVQANEVVNQHAFLTCNEFDFYANHHDFPPTPSAYSGYTSPASTFSPLSLPYSATDCRNTDSQSFFAPAKWNVPSRQAVPALETAASSSTTSEPPSTLQVASTTSTQRSSLDWNSFAIQGFNGGTAPPTPENVAPIQQFNPKIASDEAVPFQPLDDDESEGEILYGMGLYDAPELTTEDEQWRLHRSTVVSLLGGPASALEPRRRGLKLEDSWEPPANDDEDGENDDDADGEDQDE